MGYCKKDIALLLTHWSGLVQERHNSIVNTLELRLSCTEPLKWYITLAFIYRWLVHKGCNSRAYTWSLGTNFSEFLVAILIFSFKKMRLKVSSAKRRPFCRGLNELKYTSVNTQAWFFLVEFQQAPSTFLIHSFIIFVVISRAFWVISIEPFLIYSDDSMFTVDRGNA